jgi:hypothetical protein
MVLVLERRQLGHKIRKQAQRVLFEVGLGANSVHHGGGLMEHECVFREGTRV